MISIIDTKLIIFEGIPGSGKTTTSQILHKYLLEKNIDSEIYIEGCNHPIDLPFYAYLSLIEYNELLIKYPKQEKWIKENSIIEDEYILLPYKTCDSVPENTKLIEYLSSKEFCYSKKPVVDFETFKKVFYKRFEKYVNRSIPNKTITIFESVLLQHQIHDINRLYPTLKKYEIIEYLNIIANILKPLKPVLFYISQNDVEDSLKKTAVVRSKPKWSTKDTIDYYKKRKELELETISSFSIESLILDNSSYDWNKMFKDILKKISPD